MDKQKLLQFLFLFILVFFFIAALDAGVHDARSYDTLSIIGKSAVWLLMVPFTLMVAIFGAWPIIRWILNLVK